MLFTTQECYQEKEGWGMAEGWQQKCCSVLLPALLQPQHLVQSHLLHQGPQLLQTQWWLWLQAGVSGLQLCKRGNVDSMPWCLQGCRRNPDVVFIYNSMEFWSSLGELKKMGLQWKICLYFLCALRNASPGFTFMHSLSQESGTCFSFYILWDLQLQN